MTLMRIIRASKLADQRLASNAHQSVLTLRCELALPQRDTRAK
jgi:hypothetical protein